MYISIEQIRKIVRSEILKEYRQALEESSFDSWNKGEFRQNETQAGPEPAPNNDPFGRSLSATPRRREPGGTVGMEKPESANSPLTAVIKKKLVTRLLTAHKYSKGGTYTRQYEIDPNSPPGRTDLIFHPREGHTLGRDETNVMDRLIKQAITDSEPSDHKENVKYDIKIVIDPARRRS
jgi:hypothetical protein